MNSNGTCSRCGLPWSGSSTVCAGCLVNVGMAAPCPSCAAKDIVINALKAELKLSTHKTITCGVAASHPDPNLTLRVDYMKWNSPQAERVRALRAERDAALAREQDAFTSGWRQRADSDLGPGGPDFFKAWEQYRAGRPLTPPKPAAE